LTHDDLAADLALHLRTEKRMVWSDLQLGPAGSPRPDVYAIFKSYTNPCPLAYECKVSLSDFRSDVTSGKWQSYLEYACGVYFAAEASLGVTKADVPTHCGLILRGEKGWRAAKKAVLNPVRIPQDAFLKLLIDGIEREGPRCRTARRVHSDHISALEDNQRLGADVALAVRDLQRARLETQWALESAERIRESAEQEAKRIRETAMKGLSEERVALASILGIPEDSQVWVFRQAVAKLRVANREHPVLAEYRALTDRVRRAVENHGFKEMPPDDEENDPCTAPTRSPA